MKKCSKAKNTLLLPEITPNYELFAEYLNTFFSAVDENGLIHYVNSPFAKALGWRQKDLIGRHAYEIILEYNSEGVFQWDRITEVLSNPTNVPVRALELRRKNGDTLWVEMRERLYMLAEKKLRLSVSTNLDVTAQKKSKAEIKQLYDFHFASAFMNNAVRNRFDCAEVFRFFESANLEMKPPIVVLFLKNASCNPCSVNKNVISIDWKHWGIPVMNYIADDHRHLVWDTAQGIALLLCLSPMTSAEDQIKVVIHKFIDQLQTNTLLVKPVLGVSEVWNQSGILSTLVSQAMESVHWGIAIDPGKDCYYWENLGIGQLLLSLNPDQAKQFFSRKLAPLLSLPETNQCELLQTLCELLISNSVADSANRMHVHPKTIAYRRTRLEKLLNVDFNDPTARAELFIAWRLFQIHREKEEETRLL